MGMGEKAEQFTALRLTHYFTNYWIRGTGPSSPSFSLRSEAFSQPAHKKYRAGGYEKMKPLEDNPLPRIHGL